MSVSEPRQRAAVPSRRGNALVWGIIVFHTLVFAALTAYQIIARNRDEIDPDKLRELASATVKPATDEKKQVGAAWPQWRGPNRDGVSTETGLLTSWPDDGPRVLWRQPTGAGYSSVVVARGAAFTMFQSGEDEAVVCWDAETGHERWRFKYQAHLKQQYGDGPRATPALAGEYIYTVGGTGVMHCLKAFTTNPAGESVWRKDLLKEFDGPLLTWGTAFSPLVDRELVFIMPGGPNGNAIAALNKDTGAVVWKQLDDLPSYSSPVSAELAGQRQIVFLTGERLVGVVPETGRLLWDFPWTAGPGHTPNGIVTPLVIHLDIGDYLFVSSGYANGCALLKIEPDGDRQRASQVYKNGNMQTIFSSCVRHGDFLYGFDDSNLKCLELRSGTMKWKESGRAPGHELRFGKGSVTLADGHLIIFGDGGLLALAVPDPQRYREVARFEHSDQPSSWTVPVFAGGRLYVRDKTRLVCYDVKKSP